MAELIKDFIKFVSEVILILVILSITFSDQGIISNTFNFLVYAEPILIQNYLATTLTAADYAPGDFTSSIQISGSPHIITIRNENGIVSVQVTPRELPTLNTRYARIEKTDIMVSCSIEPVEITLQKDVSKQITVQKRIEDGLCRLEVIA